MKHLENWFLCNNLIINTEKTKVMLFQGNESGSITRPILHLKKKRTKLLIKFEILGNLHY
jgi:hypothetical protein